MKIQHGLCGFLVFIGVVLSTTPASAYYTTKQSAKVLNDTTVLFTITYRFGFLNRELYMPIATLRTTGTSTRDRAGYTLVDAQKKIHTNGTTTALVLSTAAIKDGMYYLPKGKSADFTLVTLLTVPAGVTPEKYALQVSSLPFTMIDTGTKYHAQLNPSELQYYITPTVTVPRPKLSAEIVGITYTLHKK